MGLRESNSLYIGLVFSGLCIAAICQGAGAAVGAVRAEQAQEPLKVVVPIFQDAFLASEADEGVGDATLTAGRSGFLEFSSFLQFTDPPIAPEAVVVGARLRLHCFGSPADVTQGIFELRTLGERWSETDLRRSNRPASEGPGADWEITCDESVLHNDLSGPQFTEMVRRIVAGEVENHGWELRGKPGEDTTRFVFHSKETGAADFPLGKQPLLEIEYRLGPGPGPTQGTASVTPTLTPGATISATPSSTVTNTATEAVDPSATATSAMTGAPERLYLPMALANDRLQALPAERPLSNWSYLLPTDDVHQLTLDAGAGRLWSVGGGLVAWDLRSGNSRVYTLRDGLPTNAVGDLALAGDDRPWLGTSDKGAAWLGDDGRWHSAPFARSSLQGILDMGRDPEGDLWFGTRTGASRLDRDGAWTHYRADTGTVAGTVPHLAFDGLGNRWFGTYFQGLSVLRADGSWHTYRLLDRSGLPSDAYSQLSVDALDRLWVQYIDPRWWSAPETTSNEPRFKLRDPSGAWSDFDLSPLPVDTLSVRKVFFDAENRPWFATREGLLEPDPAAEGSWKQRTVEDGLLSDDVRDLVFDADGEVWVATDRGISRRGADGVWQSYRRDSIPRGKVVDLDLAEDGLAWLASQAGLVAYRQDGSWSAYGAEDGLFADGVSKVKADDRGGVWLASWQVIDDEDQGGVQYLDRSGALSSYGVEDGLLTAEVKDIAVDSLGNTFFANGTYYYAPGKRRDGGLTIRGADGRWSGHLVGEGPPEGGDPQVLHVDDNDTLWIGSEVIAGAKDESLARRLPHGRFEIVPLPESLLARNVHSLASDLQGRLWVGTNSGVAVRDRDGSWTTPQDDPNLQFFALTMARDDAGALWFGSDFGVRIQHPNGAWEHLEPDAGLGMRSVRALEFGPDGRAWFAGGEIGVSILEP